MTDTATRPTVRTRADTRVLRPERVRSFTLPVSGWRVNWREHCDGRAVLEVADADGELVGLTGSAHQPMLSVDAAWRGLSNDVDGVGQWWALAIGHAGPNGAAPVVTFTRRFAVNGSTVRTVLEPAEWHGLWIAAVPGLYTSVSCCQDGGHRVRRLAPAPTFDRA